MQVHFHHAPTVQISVADRCAVSHISKDISEARRTDRRKTADHHGTHGSSKTEFCFWCTHLIREHFILKIKLALLVTLSQVDDVDSGRECIIKGLCVYLNKDRDSLVREYVASTIIKAAEEAFVQGSIEEATVGIYVLKHRDAHDRPEDVGIVLEGQMVLQDLDNFASAAAMLFGLMYTLNLNYAPELKDHIEVLQKMVMEREGSTLSKKAQILWNRLYE
ncbi:uncharacterized protein LOC127650818 [Xyrauchen texanus]|uniref:uncharacterized protein LOC127650818 n=1 Tax=Xyrauchen texanus TaxID=154827 RepID=UPI002241F41B|nr:uncharacterized protein LOC127650818 [Xyrauchen texanus]